MQLVSLPHWTILLFTSVVRIFSLWRLLQPWAVTLGAVFVYFNIGLRTILHLSWASCSRANSVNVRGKKSGRDLLDLQNNYWQSNRKDFCWFFCCIFPSDRHRVNTYIAKPVANILRCCVGKYFFQDVFIVWKWHGSWNAGRIHMSNQWENDLDNTTQHNQCKMRIFNFLLQDEVKVPVTSRRTWIKQHIVWNTHQNIQKTKSCGREVFAGFALSWQGIHNLLISRRTQ